MRGGKHSCGLASEVALLLFQSTQEGDHYESIHVGTADHPDGLADVPLVREPDGGRIKGNLQHLVKTAPWRCRQEIMYNT